MNKKISLIILFWLIVVLSAIYLKTNLYSFDSNLIIIAFLDVLPFIVLSWLTIRLLEKAANNSAILKVFYLIRLIIDVKSIKGNEVVLSNCTTLPIGRTYKRELLKIFK